MVRKLLNLENSLRIIIILDRNLIQSSSLIVKISNFIFYCQKQPSILFFIKFLYDILSYRNRKHLDFVYLKIVIFAFSINNKIYLTITILVSSTLPERNYLGTKFETVAVAIFLGFCIRVGAAWPSTLSSPRKPLPIR